MQLLEVTLAGFKSFAHKTAFQFDAGLTAIIGPNGSGKSNVTEAIRWVLGEQSLKSLRGKKSDDVIFSGSEQYPRAGAATVTLTLSNDTGRLGVDAPEVALTRRIDRSGESEYLLNGEPVRLLDVQQLLAEAGIGTKSYTVISQGTVDRYLSATPAGRRELFDEATGIKPLQLKVHHAQRKLALAERDSHELQTVIAELEPRLRVLRRQIDRDQERQRVAQEYADKQAAWLHHAWHEAAQALHAAAAEQATTRQAARAARAERERIEVQLFANLATPTSPETSPIVSLQQQLEHATADYQDAEVAYHAALQEKEALTASLQLVRQELRRANAELARARTELARTDIFAQLRATLQHCAQLLEDIHANQPISSSALNQARQEIAEALGETGQEAAMVHAAEALVARLSGPLQAVARLQAIADERTKRYDALPTVTTPDDTVLRQLQRQLAALQQGTNTSPQSTPAQLGQAQTAEIAAERADSAALAQVEQARQALKEIEGDIGREKGTAFLTLIQKTPPPHAAHVPSTGDLQALALRLHSLGEIDPLAAKEYAEVAARYEHLRQQHADIAATATTTRQLITRLTREMQRRFREQFAIIQKAFAAYFIRLFDGGQAELEIVETAPDLPLPTVEADDRDHVSGIEITVHPPGKKPQHVGLLSGGEKALTALALLFAILEVQQPPFLVLDEVDAALDEANSYRFAELLKEKSRTTQCLVISHNRETMGAADVLYGITMQPAGVSKVYSVKMADIASSEAEMKV